MHKENIFKVIELIPQTIWTLVEVKNYMRIEGNYDDDLINSLIDAAIMAAENFTKLTIITRRIEFVCNIKNQQNFQLKYQPIKELIKITLTNSDGSAIELQSRQYHLDMARSLLYLNKKLENCQLMVEYFTGYDRINIPASIRHGILMHIAEMYDRERQNATSLSTEVKNLYLAYRQLKI